jgi:hypothetical protein
MATKLTPEQLREIAEKAENFSKEHVVVLCEELLEWSNTAILRGGRLRELATMISPIAGTDSLKVAESYAKSAAYEFVVQQGKTNE